MDKIALVTGASRGIGAATALLLAKQGYHLGVNYIRDGEAAETIAKQAESYGAKTVVLQADVANEDDVVNLFQQVDKSLGPVNALVNNAGILLPQSTIVDMTADRINRILSTNVTSQLLCCREAVKRMSTIRGGQGGAIVNVSSAASRIGAPNEYIDYAASKGAVDTLTIGLSQEVANQGIRVNCVRPGFIDTQMHADGGEPDRIARIAPNIPMQRGGSPEEVANAIAWLLSEDASYVTGTFIDIAGGR